MNTAQIIRALRRRWRILAACIVLATLAGAGAGFLMPRPYASTVHIVVGQCGNGSVADTYQCGMFAQTRVPTYLSLLKSSELASRTEIATKTSVAADDVEVVAAQQSVVLDITVRNSDAATAQKLATAAADQAVEMIAMADLSSAPVRLAEPPLPGPPNPLPPAPAPDSRPIEPTSVQIIGTATEPERTGRSPVITAAFGLFAGLILGIAAAVIRDRTDPRVASADDLADIADVPLLAGPDTSVRRLARRLQTSLLPRIPTSRTPVVMVTGVGDERASTELATALTAEIAASGTTSVVLVDATPTNGDESAQVGSPDEPDLENLLGEAPDFDALKKNATCTVVRPPRNFGDARSAALVSATAVDTMLDGLRENFDYVVLAVPEIDVDETAAEAFAVAADATVVHVRFGETRKAALRATLDRVPRIGASVAGLVAGVGGATGKQ